MNKQNCHKYVGSAIDFNYRWYIHKYALRKGIHHSILLQRAWDKDGEDSFEFSEIEFVDVEDLITREQYYFDLLKPEYNILPTAGNWLGMKHSEESKKKMSLSKVGKVPGNKGKFHSAETKKRMSESHKGYKHTDKARENMRLAQTGKVLSEDVRRKISKSLCGRNTGQSNLWSKTNRAKRERQIGAIQ